MNTLQHIRNASRRDLLATLPDPGLGETVARREDMSLANLDGAARALTELGLMA